MTVTGFPEAEENILVTTERVASVISLLGCCFVITTFSLSSSFRKPITRLIFYATIGNTLCNVGTLISINGMEMGSDSVLCQTQAFLIQAFLPADVFWNLAMAVNTYLTVFKKYNSAQCKAMEKWYLVVNFGGFITIAFIYCFLHDTSGFNGKLYGGAVLWCWITKEWTVFRLLTCYGPAWLAILTCFTIYIASGRRLYMQERRLAEYGDSPAGSIVENPFTSYKTTEIRITSEAVTPSNGLLGPGSESHFELQAKNLQKQYLGGRTNFEEYSITIERRDDPIQQKQRNMNEDEIRLHDTAIKDNKVAKSYALCCCLFFASLLVTWIPSSIFRVYILVHDVRSSFGMAYTTGLVLPLMGFWNALIYVAISWDAILDMTARNSNKKGWKAWYKRPSKNDWIGSDRQSKDSWGTRTRRLSLNSRDDVLLPIPFSMKQSTEGQTWTRE